MARREKFSMPPRSLSPQYKNQNQHRMTAFDHQRLAMARLKMEEHARIKNEYELHADLFNFDYLTVVDEYGFPLKTPYEVSDSVSSMYVPPLPQEDEKKQDSMSNQGSSTNPDGGIE